MSHLAKVAAVTQKKKQQHKMQTVIRLGGHSRFKLAPYTVGNMHNECDQLQLKAQQIQAFSVIQKHMLSADLDYSAWKVVYSKFIE